jgi:hypothetical protein
MASGFSPLSAMPNTWAKENQQTLLLVTLSELPTLIQDLCSPRELREKK